VQGGTRDAHRAGVLQETEGEPCRGCHDGIGIGGMPTEGGCVAARTDPAGGECGTSRRARAAVVE
jgi:hypothetical protein